MSFYITDNFLLETKTAQVLYHEFAAGLPIIDYHSHLSPKEISENTIFPNLTRVWLNDDHYKWRAMRACGISEEFITGSASDEDKFRKWAEVVPQTLRNPLYHWTHLELKRYFGIEQYLNPETAGEIYGLTSELLNSKEYSVQSLLGKMNIEVVCTTDDPVDSLEYHKSVDTQSPGFKMLPTFRPDKAMDLSDPVRFKDYVYQLEKASGVTVSDLDSYMEALLTRHNEFHEFGCRLSDHGLRQMEATDYTSGEVESVFTKLFSDTSLSNSEIQKLRSFLLYEFAKMDYQKGWTQQFHLGALRNNNRRLLSTLGPDTGFDSIGDFPQAESLSKFLNKLDSSDELSKTILYNLNPADNEVFATMVGNFNDGSVKAKMQWGSAWWFLDQLDGMEKQINTLSNMGLLSGFIGMITDSRSFMSFPRHEYFRRLLCNIIGNDVEKGLLPDDIGLLSKLVTDISYTNAKQYFNLG